MEQELRRQRDLLLPAIYSWTAKDPLRRCVDLHVVDQGIMVWSYCVFDGHRTHLVPKEDVVRAIPDAEYRKARWTEARVAVLPLDDKTESRATAIRDAD